MGWNIDEAACRDVFTKVDAAKTNLATAHTDLSTAIDTAGGVFTDAKVAAIGPALNAAWNLALAPSAANCETQVTNATSGGRSAVNAFHNGQQAMAEQFERDANTANEHAPFTDGKKTQP